MVWNKSTSNSKVTVSMYGSEADEAWLNTPYQFSANIKTVYVSGWGSNTEFFVMETVPGEAGIYNILQHAYSYNLSDVYKVTYTGSNNWYIIVNKKPTTIAVPTFSANRSTFTIGNDGVINASNAKITGLISASSITANSQSEIVGWTVAENSITYDISNNYKIGMRWARDSNYSESAHVSSLLLYYGNPTEGTH